MSLEAIFTTPNSAVHKRAMRIIKSQARPNKLEEKIGSLKKHDRDEMLNAAIKNLPSVEKIKLKIDRTGKDISIRQYFSYFLSFALLAGAFMNMVMGFGIFLTLLVALFVGISIPNMLLNRWIFKRQKQFLTLMPDALELMVRGLRSGLPVTESINSIKDEIAEPVRSVFAEISHAMKVGVPFEEALINSANKIKVNEFNFFVISVTLQRETGGNLAEILQNLAETIRGRAMMKLKIKAISSEARMSSYIVGALPFFVTAALLVISPGYLNPLVETTGGHHALMGAMFSFSLGMFIMRKMGNFEI